MEKIVSKVAALGIPGLVLLIAVSASGYAGAAAIIAALAALGPGGIIGGIATLGVIGLITHGITEYGVEAIFCAVVQELVKKGESKETILAKIDAYPISKSLKSRLREVNTPPETVPLDRTNGAIGPLKWCIATAAMVH